MPYITFSRKFDRAKSRFLLEKFASKDYVAEPRGAKTIRDIARRGLAMGFNEILVINSCERSLCRGQRIEVSTTPRGEVWRYAGGVTVKHKG